MNQLAEMAVFARVVEARGFSPAARQLHMTTSAVSRSVTRLEASMGGRLLHRSTRSVTVTELGQGVYTGCARIVQTAREVEAFASSYAARPNGTLKVSAPVTYGQVRVAPLMSEFLALFPEVDVRLDLTDQFVDLVGESVDVAIRIGAHLAPGLVARRLSKTRYVLVASRRYLNNAPAPAGADELSQHKLVCPDNVVHLPMTLGSRRVVADVVSRLRINDDRAILRAVHEGLGIGLVPDFAAAVAIDRCQAVRVLPEWSLAGEHGERPIHAVFAPTRHMPRKVRAFIDFIVGQTDRTPATEQPLGRAA